MKKQQLAVLDNSQFQLVSRFDGLDEETRAMMEEDFDDLGETSDIECRRIKVPSGDSRAFSVESDNPDDPDPMKEVVGVVLFHHLMNSRWEGDYAGGDSASVPVCTSWDGKNGSVLETGEVISCDSCPYNQYRQNAQGYNSKECKNTRRIYLMMSGSPHLYMLSVPPTSLKDNTKQLRAAMNASGQPLSRTVVKFTVVKATAKSSGNSYNKVRVDVVGRLPDELATVTAALRAEIKNQYKTIDIDAEDQGAVPNNGAPRYTRQPNGDLMDADGGFVEVTDADDSLPFD